MADVAIDYGDAWVVVEVTTLQPRRVTIAGRADEDLVADLDELVGKCRQLDATIGNLRDREQRLTHAAPAGYRRFHPVLVVTEGFPVNPISLTMLREQCRAAGLFGGVDVGDLEVLDTEELEMVEYLQETGGPGLRQLLVAKERGSMRNAALRDHVLLVGRLQPGHTDRATALFTEAFQPAMQALRGAESFDSTGPAD